MKGPLLVLHSPAESRLAKLPPRPVSAKVGGVAFFDRGSETLSPARDRRTMPAALSKAVRRVAMFKSRPVAVVVCPRGNPKGQRGRSSVRLANHRAWSLSKGTQSMPKTTTTADAVLFS